MPRGGCSGQWDGFTLAAIVVEGTKVKASRVSWLFGGLGKCLNRRPNPELVALNNSVCVCVCFSYLGIFAVFENVVYISYLL